MAYHEDVVVISSIKLNRTNADELEFVTQHQGLSKTEIIQRSLEQYLPKLVPKQIKSARDILRLVQQRSGIIPVIKNKPTDIFEQKVNEFKSPK
jgi:hypothetical protein